MKVFARYYTEEDKTYRLSTILQFGDSWDLIGSVVLLNPGSAEPKSRLDDDTLEKLSQHIGEQAVSKEWFEFSSDQTMKNIEKVFSGEKFGNKKELNGTIQLFNLFNTRNPHSVDAKLKNKDDESVYVSSILTEMKNFRNKPVYLGWGRLQDKDLKDIAKKVFSEVVKTNSYLNKKFELNCFRHLAPRSYNLVKINSEAYNYMFSFYNLLK